jgi:hypothetical protein
MWKENTNSGEIQIQLIINTTIIHFSFFVNGVGSTNKYGKSLDLQAIQV